MIKALSYYVKSKIENALKIWKKMLYYTKKKQNKTKKQMAIIKFP